MTKTYEVIRNTQDGMWNVVARPENKCVYSSPCEEDAWDWVDDQPD